MRILYRFPLLNIILILILTLFFAYWIPKLEINTELAVMLPENHPEKITLDELKKNYEMMNVISIGAKTTQASIFNLEDLNTIDSLTRDLQRIAFIDKVSSITNAELIDNVEGRLYPVSLKKIFPVSEDEINRFKEKAVSWDLYKDYLYSADLKTAVISVMLDTEKHDREILRIVDTTKKIFYGKLSNHRLRMPLPNDPSFKIYYTINNVLYTGAADPSGKIIGEKIKFGRVHYSSGYWFIQFDTPPDLNTEIMSIYTYQILQNHFQYVYDKINDILKQYTDHNLEFFLSGYPANLCGISRLIQNDIMFILIACAGIIFLILFFAFKKPAGILYPLITAFIAILWITGIIGLTGIPINLITALIPLFLLLMGGIYGYKIMLLYYETVDPTPAVHGQLPAFFSTYLKTILKEGGRVLLFIIPCAFGFIFIPLIPFREFGIFLTTGIILLVLINWFMMPSLLLLSKTGCKKPITGFTLQNPFIIRICRGFYHFFTKTGYRITGLIILLLVITCIAIPKIRVDHQLIDFFKADSLIRKADQYLNQQTAGTETLVLSLEGSKPGDLNQPVILKKMDDLSQFLVNKYPEIGKTAGINDLIKRMNQVRHQPQKLIDADLKTGDFITLMNEALNKAKTTRPLIDEMIRLLNRYWNYSGLDFYEIPDDSNKYNDYKARNPVIQFINLYSGNLNTYTGLDPLEPDRARLWLFLKTMKADFTGALIHDINQYVRNHFPAKYQVKISGPAVLTLPVNKLILSQQIFMLPGLLLFLFIITAFYLKSIRHALTALIPSLLALLTIYSLIGIYRIPINLVTAAILPLIIGPGILFSLRFIQLYQTEATLSDLPETASFNSLIKLGKSLIIQALLILISFTGLLFSSLVPYQEAALWLLIGFFLIFTSTLFILPALLKYTYSVPKNAEKPQINSDKKIHQSESVMNNEISADHKPVKKIENVQADPVIPPITPSSVIKTTQPVIPVAVTSDLSPNNPLSNNTKEEIIVEVVGGILKEGPKILIAQRKKGSRHELKWEFPGGKIEPGETPRQALIREFKEEFDVEIDIGDLIGVTSHVYHNITIELLVYWVYHIRGEIKIRDHEKIEWIDVYSLSNYDFLETDREIIKLII